MSLQKDKNFWRFFCAHLVMRIFSTQMYCEGSEELMEQQALEPSQIQIRQEEIYGQRTMRKVEQKMKKTIFEEMG